MRRLRFRTIGLLMLLLAVAAPSRGQELPRSRPEHVGLSAARLERLTETLQQYADSDRLAGAVLLVVRRGQVAYLEAVGERDREASSPMTPDAIFRIASQSKAIVSVAAMTLVEEGRLRLSDPVGRHLPEFLKTTVAVPDESGGYAVVDAERPITIRDLLTHTSGVSYGSGPAKERWAKAGFQGWYFADRDEPIRESVRRIAALPFDAQPGKAWVYGYSTDILGAVVEQVSGQPLDAFVSARVLEPLGMRDTHFYLPDTKRDRLAVVYSATPAGTVARAPDPGQMVGQGAYLDGPRRSFSAGAGLLSTARDYARFLQMLLADGTLDGVRVLSRKTVELMTIDHLVGLPFRPGQGFGLGFSVVEDLGARGVPGSVGEFGWGGAYHSTYWVDPAEELVVVYLTQLIPADGLDDHETLRALIYQAIAD